MRANYVRQLEDAVLVLWSEMSVEEVKVIRDESPALIEFLRHLHQSIEHERAMTRNNVWAES